MNRKRLESALRWCNDILLSVCFPFSPMSHYPPPPDKQPSAKTCTHTHAYTDRHTHKHTHTISLFLAWLNFPTRNFVRRHKRGGERGRKKRGGEKEREGRRYLRMHTWRNRSSVGERCNELSCRKGGHLLSIHPLFVTCFCFSFFFEFYWAHLLILFSLFHH